MACPTKALWAWTDIADHTAPHPRAVDVPLIVDADTGFGNALNTYHAMRTLERAGAELHPAGRPSKPQALRPLQRQRK